MAPASAPAPALDVEGEVGGGNSQNALKSEADGERSVAPKTGGGSVPGEFRSDDPATDVCEDGIDSSDVPALAVDVNGEGGGAKENLGKVRVKSEPEHFEGEGAVLAPCTGPAGANFVGIASSSSYKLPVASPEDSTDERGGDSTECSSSFADSGDEAGNGDLEVNSPFSVHANGGQTSAMPRNRGITTLDVNRKYLVVRRAISQGKRSSGRLVATPVPLIMKPPNPYRSKNQENYSRIISPQKPKLYSKTRETSATASSRNLVFFNGDWVGDGAGSRGLQGLSMEIFRAHCGSCLGGEDSSSPSGRSRLRSIASDRESLLRSAEFRRKKVTAEWRNAVRPMLWRCEWLELRMKDLLSQVSKYDGQLALIEQEKELQRATSKTNGCRQESGKNCRDHETISMERRKRKRHEDTVDTSLYLKKHKILSYFFDKQNKGADADGLLIDDDSHGQDFSALQPADICGTHFARCMLTVRKLTDLLAPCSYTSPNAVGDDTRRRLEIVGLPASKEYDMASNQFVLQKVLMKIGGIQSRVHRLQERLSKARSKQAKLASFMDHDQVKVAEKRQRIQKRAFSPENDRYAKPQKKKKLNILLEQEDRPTLSVNPTLSERATDCLIEDPQGNSEEKALERSQAHKKDITADLLLAVESSLPNGHLGDLCKENTDDILIDNQGAKDGYQPFENTKHPPEEPPVLIENVAKTAPSKVGNTSEPVEAEKSLVPLVKQEVTIGKLPVLKHVYSGKKRGRTPKTEDMDSAAASKNHNKEASETPSAKQKAETTPCAENENAGSKKQKTVDIRSPSNKSNSGNSCSAAEKLKIGNSSSAAKAQKSGSSSSSAKAPKTGNSSSDGNKQAAGNSSSAAKKPKMGNSSSDGKKQAAGNSFTAAKPKTGKSSPDGKKQAAGNSSAPARTEMSENIHTNLRIEKAILVEVNSRRSQRVGYLSYRIQLKKFSLFAVGDSKELKLCGKKFLKILEPAVSAFLCTLEFISENEEKAGKVLTCLLPYFQFESISSDISGFTDHQNC
ncbi:hypothetical protein TRIUR3_21659 [Triticum urartu]|uniref:Uncharacterized protein n=1 Tax=Triticum urartu TaxID=4572 RepID=M7YWE9_TRIUA|nr:hypothetical protein TRIUR3_21659 [Triticum urartu]